MQEKPSIKVNMQLNNLYVLLLFFVLALVGIGMLYVSKATKDRVVTVSGRSSSVMRNKIASFSITLEVNNEDKQTAVKEAAVKSQSIVSAVRDFGIPEADVETTNMNVYRREEPVLENGVTVYKPGNWYASYSINVTLRDLNKSTELTALLTSFESTSMWGPNLQIDDENVDEATLLQSAIANARAKADAMAAQVGKRVGGALTVTESNSYDNPIMYARGLEGMGGGAGFPIEAGSTEVQKYVVVTFWMK